MGSRRLAGSARTGISGTWVAFARTAAALAIAAWTGTAALQAQKYGASFSASPPSKVIAGEVFSFPVTVTNTGTETWTRDDCEASSDFRLASHWLNGPQPVLFDFPASHPMRSLVPTTIKQGDSKTGRVFVRAPDVAGTYTLQLDLVQEMVTWFTTHPDKVPGGFQEFPIEVQPAGTASPEVREAVAWEPLVTPNKLHRVYVLRTGPCAVNLTFSDGSPPQTLAADQPYVERVFDKLGDVTITATGTGGCSGSKSTHINVGDTACFLFGLTLKVCTLFDFDCCATDPFWCPFDIFDFLLPPKITSVDDLPLSPGGLTAIRGERFTMSDNKPGKVEVLLKDWQGKDVKASFTGMLSWTEPHWEREVIYAAIDLDLSGVQAQTAFLRVTRADGAESDLFPFAFEPATELRVVPASMVTVDECSDEVHCNMCNSELDCAGGGGAPFLSGVDTSIVGYHHSIPASTILAAGVFDFLNELLPSDVQACFLGGGSGVDKFSTHLKNGWRLHSHWSNFSLDKGSTVELKGLVPGSSDVSAEVHWSVDSCKSMDYHVGLYAIGPNGVPWQ